MKTPARRPSRSAVPTRAERERFLEALARGHSITYAAELGGRSRQRFYELRDTNEEFAAAWEVAFASGIDRLEDALVRAAVEGWEETDVIEKGGAVVSRITKHRKRPELLARVREWRRPPVGVEVQVTAPLGIEGVKPVGWADLFEIARATGQAHLLGLTPEGIAAPSEDVVDAEIEELAELPPAASNADAAVTVPPNTPEPDDTARPLSGHELGKILAENRDLRGRTLDIDGGRR